MDMMAIRRRVLIASKKKRLPREYQEVEYIESTGTQYIYTDVQGKSGYVYSARVMWNGGNDTSIMGARKSSTDRIMPIHQYPHNKWTLAYGSSHSNLSKIVYGDIYDVDAKLISGEQELKINGDVVYQAMDTTEYINNHNLAMFACAYSQTDIRLFALARIYRLSIAEKSGVLLANFIPCYRKPDGEIGMYDTVSKTFYTNAGTGTFLKGADV